MYQYSFFYKIVSRNSRIEELLREVSPLEDCLYSFQTVSAEEGLQETARPDTVYLLDGEDLEGLPAWLSGCESCILIAREGSRLLQKPEIVSAAAAVWVIPESGKDRAGILKAYFARLAERMKKQAEANRQSICFETLAERVPFAVLVEDEEGIVLNKNPHFDHYFPDYTDIVGKPDDEWKSSLSKKILLEDDLKEVVVMQSGGEQRMLIYEEEPVRSTSEQEIGKLVTLMDVMIERNMAEENAHNANTDYLTGLSNRRSLMRYLEKVHARDDFTLVMIDLDNFKQVNDNFGHEAGDKALIETAEILRECFSDQFIARLGGDEFMVVESKKRLDEVKRDAMHLQELFCRRFGARKEFQGITSSIGVLEASAVEEEDRHVANLMKMVDEMLYKAKKSGKNRYCVYGEDREQEN